MPDLKRLARAEKLAVDRKGDGWLVSGGARPHVVNNDATECDCEDFAFRRRGGGCKHIRVVKEESPA
jgi:predicted nucleic acid-binding Zn finger protein